MSEEDDKPDEGSQPQAGADDLGRADTVFDVRAIKRAKPQAQTGEPTDPDERTIVDESTTVDAQPTDSAELDDSGVEPTHIDARAVEPTKLDQLGEAKTELAPEPPLPSARAATPAWESDEPARAATGAGAPPLESKPAEPVAALESRSGLAETKSLATAELVKDLAVQAAGAESRKKRVLTMVTKIAKRSAQLGLILLLLGVLAVVLVIRHFEQGLPSVEQLKTGYDPPQVTRVLARDGTTLATLFIERRTVIPISDLPSHAKLAFLAAEDASFYEHEGLNYLGMLRALWTNLSSGRTRQGGSTITQQVVKNVLLEPERTYRRKIRETILARRLEQYLTKDEIFGLYLNHIYLGHGRYGIEEAARYYFGKKAKELDLPEAALLAGLVASPERYSARNAPEKALERRRYVLGQMLDKGFITPPIYAQAKEVPLRLAPAVEAESELAPEIVSKVNETLREVAGERARRGGFVVTTSIDPTLQAAARKAVRDNLDKYLKRQKLEPPFTLKKRRLWGAPFTGTPKAHHVYTGEVVGLDDRAGTVDVRVGDVVGRVQLKDEERYNPKRLPPSEFVEKGAALRVSLGAEPAKDRQLVPLRLELGPEAALVAIDVRTHEVLALIGSYEALAGGLDRASRAKRQPGSSFKPFLYSYALHSRRLTPASVLELTDRKTNETRRLSVRDALAKSDNAAAEQIINEVGPANVAQWAHAAGIQSKLGADLSLALGSYEVVPIELCNAYVTIADGGEYAPPVLIKKIVAPDGRELPLPQEPPKRRVMQPDEAYLITSLMQGVVQNGTAKRAQALGRPIAGKTGTTNDAKDAWFVGFSTDIATAVWVGYDDPIPLGWGEQGAVTALPAFVQFMANAHKGKPVTSFPRPASIVLAKVDPASGHLAYSGQEDAIEEEFLEGTIPSETASPDAGAADHDAGAEGPDTPLPDAGPLPPAPIASDAATPNSFEAGPIVPEPPPF